MNSILRTGIENHQQGHLDVAARAYEQVIANNPDDATPWNLLGVVAHQKGDHRRAMEFIRHAIRLNPHSADVYANLAEVCRVLGLFEEAEEACLIALQIEPECSSAANNLGLAWQSLGRNDDAIRQFQQALKINPDFALAHNNLGTALRHAGRIDEALTHFRDAVALNPNLSAAHSNLGQLLLERYQRQESLHHCREAVRLQPHSPEAHNNLGNVLRELGQLKDARECYSEALRLNPGLALTCNNMGQVFHELGQWETSLKWYQRGLQLDPNSAGIHSNIGGLFHEQEQYSIAIKHFERAKQIDPTCAEAHYGCGCVLHDQGELESALTHFREALKHRPELAMAHCSIGTVQQELGHFKDAESSFRQAIRLDPDYPAAHAQLATLLRGKLPASDLSAIRDLVADSSMTDAKRSALHFGLAHVDDARADFASAAEHLRQANAFILAENLQRGKAYSTIEHEELVAGIIEYYNSEYFERIKDFGLKSTRSVFIIGLPRSGTTLTEQMLAGHSQVFGAGELGLAGAVFASLPQLLEVDVPPWKCGAYLDKRCVGDIAERYLKRLKMLNDSAPRVVDKMPDNYLFLGLIATLFSNAKIIHCRRDLRDIGVSCWMTNFRQIRWANKFEHIAKRFHAYQKLMEHWNRVLPVSMLQINYEETVANPEETARRLVDWCGLEWEPSCATHHQQQRAIRTASATQVRQPIYGTSVARWKNYEPALTPLFELLQMPNQSLPNRCG